MEKNRLRNFVVLMIGAVAVTGCSICGLYPFVPAFFAAAYVKFKQRWFLVISLLLMLYVNAGIENLIKYGVCILAAAIIYEMILRSRAKVKTAVLAALMSGIVLVTEVSGVTFSKEYQGWYILLFVFEGILIFALTHIFSRTIGVLTRQRGTLLENGEMVSIGFWLMLIVHSVEGLHAGSMAVMPFAICFIILMFSYIYGAGMGAVAGTAIGIVMLVKTGDMTYFGVFCLLGVIVGFFNKIGKLAALTAYFVSLWVLALIYVPFILESSWLVGLLAAGGVFLICPVKSRWTSLEDSSTNEVMDDKLRRGQKKLGQTAEGLRKLAGSVIRVNKEDDVVFATGVQLNEAACILEKISNTFLYMPEKEKHSEEEELIRAALTRKGYIVKSVEYVKGAKGEGNITARLCNATKVTETAREAAVLISAALGKSFKVTEESRTIINSDFADYSFVEEPGFMMLHATAGKTKSGEEVSGDNFTFTDIGGGEILLGIVDGMGSGSVAGEESEMVIELLEELLKAGFNNEAALKLINSMLISRNEERSLAALDMAIGDMYTGRFEFVKLGAAATFIKRNRWVEILKSTNYPMGILKEVDYENTVKKLYDGDYIIMVSDGVLDAVADAVDKEELLMGWISEYDKKNPKEFAKYILDRAINESGGVLKDDMTVLVAGIWEKKA